VYDVALNSTGLDYADQRFYASTYGRFLTPDPAGAGGASSGSSSNSGDPVSWNRYAYTGGDPVNRVDPMGTDWIIVNGGWCSTLDPSGGCYDPGYGDPDFASVFSACPSPSPGLMALLQGSPDSPTFYAQLQAMGCLSNGATVNDDEDDGPPDLGVGSAANCAQALAELVAATLAVTRRLTEITPGGFDPGHRKALAQALNRLLNAEAAVNRSCVNLLSAAVAAALAAAQAAAAAAEEVLAAAVTSGPIPVRPPVTPGGPFAAPVLTAPVGALPITLPIGILPIGGLIQ